MSTIANTDMAKAWDGDEGEYWAAHADRYDAAGRRQWQRFLDGAFVARSDRVLDIGCGAGKSTRDAARLASEGSALGVDLSARMLARARELSAAEGLVNIAFEQADAQVHPFAAGQYDLAISSFGAMFFADQVAAFANIGRALRPAGRLAMLTWRPFTENEWVRSFFDALAAGRTLPEPPPDAPGPFGLADAGHVRSVLGDAGFADVALAPVDDPIEFGTDAEDAWSFVRGMGIVRGLTADLDEAARERALERLRGVLTEHDTGAGVLFTASAWLVTARRAGAPA